MTGNYLDRERSMPERRTAKPLTRGVTIAGILAICAVQQPSASSGPRRLTIEARVVAQEAIERVHYRHQIGTQRPLEEAVPRSLLEKKVRTYLAQSVALERFWQTPVTAGMLRAELERMARDTRMPDRLAEIFDALGNDAFLIQECLARPALVDRLARQHYASDPDLHEETRRTAAALREQLLAGTLDPHKVHPLRQVVIWRRGSGSGDDDRLTRNLLTSAEGDGALLVRLSPEKFSWWRASLRRRIGEIGRLVESPDAHSTTVILEDGPGRVRTAQMVVKKVPWDEWWPRVAASLDVALVNAVAEAHDIVPPVGGDGDPERVAARASDAGVASGNGFRAPACSPDTWEPTAVEGAPFPPREDHTAVWTGSQMIIWGGALFEGTLEILGNGGRYDPATDTWAPTTMTDAPFPRYLHTAVWTGSHMLVWGGETNTTPFWENTGGLYDPIADTWIPTATNGAPAGRSRHTAIWTGSEMLIWGGDGYNWWETLVNELGARYDPSTGRWVLLSQVNAPSLRLLHTALWTGERMVVWGGDGLSPPRGPSNTGGQYDPVSDTWLPVSASAAPEPRFWHTAVWTGTEMVVWGGSGSAGRLDNGGRYDPVNDVWRLMSPAGSPAARSQHTAVWTGAAMIVWGGETTYPLLNTGGRYEPVVDRWSPTSVNGPVGRMRHTAVWTGDRMIVWGGRGDFFDFNDGGLYCPCAAALFYADGDGDGHGDGNASVQLCASSPGFVANGDDCDDGDPTIWGLPSEVPDLRFADNVTLLWSPPADLGGAAVVYDALMSEDPADFVMVAACVASDTPEVSVPAASDPPVARAFYYLARAENGCPGGTGPLGVDSSDAPRVGRACP